MHHSICRVPFHCVSSAPPLKKYNSKNYNFIFASFVTEELVCRQLKSYLESYGLLPNFWWAYTAAAACRPIRHLSRNNGNCCSQGRLGRSASCWWRPHIVSTSPRHSTLSTMHDVQLDALRHLRGTVLSDVLNRTQCLCYLFHHSSVECQKELINSFSSLHR